MPKWNEDWTRFMTPGKACWKLQASLFHVASEYSARAGGRLLTWLEGNLSGADKRVSRPFPAKEGLTVGMAWIFPFKLDAVTVNDTIVYHLNANQEGLDAAAAGYNANALVIAGDGTMTLLRYDGAGAFTNILTPGWAADALEHIVVITREVSGANRFWRIYLDPPVSDLFNAAALIAGPQNEATYAVATYMGIRHGATGRQRTGPFLMQW